MKSKQKKISHSTSIISTSGGTSESRGAAECIGEEQITDLSKTHVDDDRTPDSTGKEKECMKLKKNLGIATWNVRSMSSGKLDNIVEEAARTEVDILGIAEHRWPGQGHFRPSAGGLMVYAGRTRGGQGGVSLYIIQKATKSLLGYHPVNDRIISIHLRGKVKDVTVVQTYAPTSNATEEDRELFYSQLQTHVNKYRKDVVVIVGDFNAKVGKRTNENEKRAIGNFALGERNDNGEELVNFAIENELSIMNTLFQKHPRRLFTWTSPDGNTKNQIDYVLIQQRWKSAISDVGTVPSADYDSDHEMLKATFKIRLRTMEKFQMPIRHDTSNISKEYCIEVRNKFEALNATTEEMRPEELANKAKEIFTKASKHLKTKQQKKQKWLSDEALQKMQERRMAKS